MLEVRLEGEEDVIVYRNSQWVNFLYSRTTMGLLAFSFFGILAYIPYVKLKRKKTRVASLFEVNADAPGYWKLIQGQLNPHTGFNHNSNLNN